MPNWCHNTATITHKSADKMAEVIESVTDNKFFQTMVPEPHMMPQGWYEWRLENWGTKWVADDLRPQVSEDGMRTDLDFNTAWGPPIEIYEAMKKRGYEVEAEFHEPNMEIEGYWTNAEGEMEYGSE